MLTTWYTQAEQDADLAELYSRSPTGSMIDRRDWRCDHYWAFTSGAVPRKSSHVGVRVGAKNVTERNDEADSSSWSGV
jgi:hypothetical protein